MFRKLKKMSDANVEAWTDGEYADMEAWHADHTDYGEDLDIPLDVYIAPDEPMITAKELSVLMMDAKTFDIRPEYVWAYVHTPSYGYECSMENLLCVVMEDGVVAYVSEHLFEMLTIGEIPDNWEWTTVPGVIV